MGNCLGGGTTAADEPKNTYAGGSKGQAVAAAAAGAGAAGVAVADAQAKSNSALPSGAAPQVLILPCHIMS